MSNAHLPSPTKKPSLGAPRPAAPADPTDIRGSMSKQARTGFEDSVAWRATQARAAVAQGHILPNHLNARRPLGKSQTEPVLSFNSSAAGPTRFPPFQTNHEILNLVYTDGKRPNELRPFGETGGGGRDDATGPSLYSRTLSHSNSSHGTTPDAAMMMVAGDGGDGDGFDLDEVFGAVGTTTTKSTRFDLPPPSSDFDSQDSTRTVTQRTKRAYEGEDSAATLVNDDDDDDMVATDVEDDGGDDRVPSATTLSSMFGGPAGSGGERRISGAKRAFGKTKSLPASAFHSMDF
ncbi:hypothetical protein JCM11491_004936 [Sporobolomyces phaffii]